MRQNIIVDTGVIVAALDSRDHYHQWVQEELLRIEPPLLTCEAVLSEVCFLVRRNAINLDSFFSMIASGSIVTDFAFQAQAEPIQKLMTRYRSVPMSFADACLVRMSELMAQGTIFTLDRDFRIYRKSRDQVIPLLMPS